MNFTGNQERKYEADLANYHVIDTDYENYSLVYSCSVPWWGLTALKWDLLWILTRKENTDVTAEELTAWKAIVTEKVPEYNHDYMYEGPAKDCKYKDRWEVATAWREYGRQWDAYIE